jgi:hypothetical protein
VGGAAVADHRSQQVTKLGRSVPFHFDGCGGNDVDEDGSGGIVDAQANLGILWVLCKVRIGLGPQKMNML